MAALDLPVLKRECFSISDPSAQAGKNLCTSYVHPACPARPAHEVRVRPRAELDPRLLELVPPHQRGIVRLLLGNQTVLLELAEGVAGLVPRLRTPCPPQQVAETGANSWARPLPETCAPSRVRSPRPSTSSCPAAPAARPSPSGQGPCPPGPAPNGCAASAQTFVSASLPKLRDSSKWALTTSGK